MSASVLVTGFEPFGRLARNPSQDVVRALAKDPALARLAVRTAVLPVHRHRAPKELARLLGRHAPRALVLTGVAAGRPAISLERIGVNCYRRPREPGPGRPIVTGGPDGLFSTVPLEGALAALEAGGVGALLSETAGLFTCNLVLYSALLWGRDGLPDGRPGPGQVAFVHLPATPESRPPGPRTPTAPLSGLVRAVRSLVLQLAEGGEARRSKRAGWRPSRDGT